VVGTAGAAAHSARCREPAAPERCPYFKAAKRRSLQLETSANDA
jgi:hypothetical protein